MTNVLSVAVIVGLPAVVELVNVAEYVPSPLSLSLPNWIPGSLDENTTASPIAGAPPPSVTVAVAIDVEVPSATIELGCSETDTLGPSAHDGAAKYQLS